MKAALIFGQVKAEIGLLPVTGTLQIVAISDLHVPNIRGEMSIPRHG